MAYQGSNNNVAYGLNNPLQTVGSLPIIARRAPSTSDSGQFGQLWIYNNIVWCLTSHGVWTQLSN